MSGYHNSHLVIHLISQLHSRGTRPHKEFIRVLEAVFLALTSIYRATMQRLLKQTVRSGETKDATDMAIAGLQQALSVLQLIAGDLGVPGLQTGVSCLSTVLAMVKVCV